MKIQLINWIFILINLIFTGSLTSFFICFFNIGLLVWDQYIKFVDGQHSPHDTNLKEELYRTADRERCLSLPSHYLLDPRQGEFHWSPDCQIVGSSHRWWSGCSFFDKSRCYLWTPRLAGLFCRSCSDSVLTNITLYCVARRNLLISYWSHCSSHTGPLWWSTPCWIRWVLYWDCRYRHLLYQVFRLHHSHTHRPALFSSEDYFITSN